MTMQVVVNCEKLSLLDQELQTTSATCQDSSVIDSLEKKTQKIKRKTVSLVKKWLCNLRMHYGLLEDDEVDHE